MPRTFRPSPLSTALTLALIAAFLWLGNWQLERAAEKTALQTAFDAAPRLTNLPPAGEAAPYSRIRVQGRFDPHRHVLLDNQVYRTRPGVHVLTPFYLEDGRVLLVNRGWLPLAQDRRSLPDVPTPTTRMHVSGILDHPYQPGTRLGEPDRVRPSDWPQLVTYPDAGAIGAALDSELYPLVLLLDPAHPAGFHDRHWQPVHTGAVKHEARALQWFTFIPAAIALWAYLGFRRGAEK